MAIGKKRELNSELLRIIAMLMIVCLHYLGKGGMLGDPARAEMSAAGYTAWFIEAFCLVAVNVYVLISGYFGVNTQHHSFQEVLKRPFKIWKQVFFYSMLFGCAALIIGTQEFDLYQFFSYCFPIVTEHYWFATAYVILCLMMPFLNAGITYLDQKEIKYLLIGLLLIFSISKTVIPMQLPWDKYGYDCLWFIVLYLTGAYLRRYEISFLKTRWRAAGVYIGSMSVIFASFFLIRMIFLKTGRLEDMINYGYSYNFLFCYTGAVGLLLLFRKKGKISEKLERFRKTIELLSGATFGVYLIHEHINIRYAWQKWFHCETQMTNSVAGFLLHMLCTVLCVYLICTVIELIRQKGNMTILPALILLLYPLRHAAIGLDLMDAGYSLGNYRFFDSVNEMWKLATYLANITGVLISKLPFGNYWIGMNVYCGLLIGAVAASVYLFLWKSYGQKRKLFCVLLFVAEITALSLCWSPNVTLYHYLGYLLMTVAVMILFAAIIKNKKRYYIAAGVILGLCVMVRMPNITYMALILPVWCDCFWNRSKDAPKKNAWLVQMAQRTLYCIGGYLIGLLIPFTAICACYGIRAYPQMIFSLFGMTDSATDYKPTSMVMAMFGDYIRYSSWLFFFVIYMILGGILFHVTKKGERNHTLSKKVSYVLEIFYSFTFLVLLRFCYGRGMFDFDYSAYFCMYKWVTVYLLIVIALCIWFLINKITDKKFKLWAVFLLVIIFVTPLGSNNGLYPIINNLFLVMPVSMLMIAEVFRKIRKSETMNFAFCFVLGAVFVCTTIQSILFGIGFVFHDAGAQNNAFNKNACLELQCSSTGTGLMTTTEKKAAVEELDQYLFQNELNQKQVILYGDIPTLSYLFDMEPAISTTWADLDSYSIETLEKELQRVTSDEIPDIAPVIIFGR
ncbi:MAG: acyltransferase, partial [Lachnospiraceae bacterium]|nr:acyltransferase [Lachnospiraceae bacterium]